MFGVVLLLNEVSKDSAANGIDPLACPAGPQLSSAVQTCNLCSSEADNGDGCTIHLPCISLAPKLDQPTSSKLMKGGDRQALGRGYSLFPLTLADTPWVVTPPWARTCEMTAGTLGSLAPHPNAHLTKIYKPRSGEQCFKNSYPAAMRWRHAAGSRTAWPYGKGVSNEADHHSVVLEELRNIGRCEPVNVRERERTSSWPS